jgi:armadillo repeat-containing protein 6
MDILRGAPKSLDIRASSFAVIASASTGNEVVKELFMEFKVDELLVDAVKDQSNNNMQSLYDAIRVILTPDDGRVAASQVIVCKTCYVPIQLFFLRSVSILIYVLVL